MSSRRWDDELPEVLRFMMEPMSAFFLVVEADQAQPLIVDDSEATKEEVLGGLDTGSAERSTGRE
jgi:hypothetical protein